jgi:hypothetical protein
VVRPFWEGSVEEEGREKRASCSEDLLETSLFGLGTGSSAAGSREDYTRDLMEEESRLAWFCFSLLACTKMSERMHGYLNTRGL